MINGRDTFTISDHRNLSYLAADALGSSGHNIGYQRTGGWFITRVQASLLTVLVIILLVLAVLFGRSSVHRTLNNVTSTSENVTSVSHPELPEVEIKPSHDSKELPGILQVPFSLYSVQPLHYEIYIQPNMQIEEKKGFTFKGNVTINLHAKEPITTISLMAQNLQIHNTTLSEDNIHNDKDPQKLFTEKENKVNQEKSSNFTVSVTSYNQEDGILNLSLSNPITPDKLYNLSITFSGHIHELPYGVFNLENSETAISGITKPGHIVATNFDSPFSRTIFPCFEVPGQKSKFQINIARKRDKISCSSTWLSNKSNIIENDYIWDSFDPTPRIGIDQLGFAVSDFYPEIKSTNKMRTFAIWYKSLVKEREFEYIMEKGIELINFYEDYFGIKIPAGKLDIFILTSFLNDYKSYFGIGLIKEEMAVVKPNFTSEERKKSVAKILSSIICEQWFGPIITLKSYDDKWLKTALSQYVSYIGINSIEPKWNIYNDFLNNVIQTVMYTNNSDEKNQPKSNDVLKNTAELNQKKIKPTNKTLTAEFAENGSASFVSNIFQSTSFGKEACLIHMFRNGLTESVFKNSLKKFLELGQDKEFVTSENLWHIMTTEANNLDYENYKLLPDGVSMAEIMKNLLETNTYPLLTVTRNYRTNSVNFRQVAFGLDEIVAQNLSYLPISYTTGNTKNFTDTVTKIWIDKDQPEYNVSKIPNLINQSWLLVNPQHTNFYRVQYDSENWRMLHDALYNAELPGIIASQLIDDSLYLSSNYLLPYEFSLNMTIALSHSNTTDYPPWHTVLQHFNYMDHLLRNSSNYTIFKDYTKNLLYPVYEQLDHIDKGQYTHENAILKSKIFVAACMMGSEECRNKSKILFDQWKSMANPDLNIPIEPDMKYAVICCVLNAENATEFDFVMQRYRKMDLSNVDKIELLNSMLCAQNSTSVQTLLNDVTLTKSNNLSLPDLELAHTLWHLIITGPTVYTDMLSYLINNWSIIYDRYSKYWSLLSEIITGATININTKDQLDKLMKFKESHENQLSRMKDKLNNVITRINSNIKWRNESENSVLTWMKTQLSTLKSLKVFLK